VAIKLSSSHSNTRGLEGNSNAKLTVAPHRRGTISVSIEEVKSCVQRSGEALRSYIQRWSVIKYSAEYVSDERAIDAFVLGLHRSDLVEEMGRTKPRTVSELMEIANRFEDGEDA
jgi:hypothetical protein